VEAPDGQRRLQQVGDVHAALTMPLMRPRFSIRLERCWSRFIVIVAPCGSVDA